MNPVSGQPHALGRHLLADLHGVAPELLMNPGLIEKLLIEAARVAGATPIFSKFHLFGEGQGVTGVVLLKESHISIHTWPEYEFAAVDVFMCGDCRPELAVQWLKDALRPATVDFKEQVRGQMLEATVIDA